MIKKVNATVQDRFLESCNKKENRFSLEPVTIVIFGGGGDLSRRKLLPALYHLYLDQLLKDFNILAIGRTSMSSQKFQTIVQKALKTFSNDYSNRKNGATFSKHIYYLSGDSQTSDLYKKLCQWLNQKKIKQYTNILYYLSVPPPILSDIVQGLAQAGLCNKEAKIKIVIEKPFGKDKTSSSQLNKSLLDVFSENQIYRIDHYLGKETVQNILFFRFGNSIFEPLWNRRYIDHIQIMVAEHIGIEERGNFYEQAGVIRDIVQNHILQLLALVAMEPPTGFDADLIRNEKIKVYRSIRPFEDNNIKTLTIRGQYGPGKIDGKDVPGYRQEKNVSSKSNTPTFFAGIFYIDSWRWADVPFYIRTGKRLPRRVSEIYVQFKQPPLKLFGRICDIIKPNSLIFSIQPEEEISLELSVKSPGIKNNPQTVSMNFNYQKNLRVKSHDAYQRLIIDIIKGDLTLFARQDGIEAMWEIVDPINKYWEKQSVKEFPNYKAGTWGPKTVSELIEKDHRQWRFSEGR